MLSFHSLPDYRDSPPSPPRTLEDQVHVAYAHDDIHRAKILLLKLKGIEVTDDDDPRIAAVQDEDFDFCFIPNGKLISEEEERTMAEAQLREQKRRLREERLRTCGYIWDHAKRRMRDERLWLQRRREVEERRRAAEEAERQRVLKEKEAALQEERAVVRARSQRRSVVSYDTLPRDPPSQPSCEDPFIYDVMVHPSSSKHPTPSSSPRRSQSATPSSSPPKHCRSQLQTTRPALDDRRAISFKDVVSSLDGPLFPLTIEERQRRMSVSGSNKSRGQTRDRQRQKQAELLDSLLSMTGWESAEFRLKKGKAKPCGRCSIELPESSVSTSSSYLSSCPSLTRSNSWLSFASGSPGAFSPAPSPLIPSWLKRPSSCIICSKPCQRRSQQVPVPLSDSPLHPGSEIAQVELVIGSKDEIHLPRARRQSLVGAASAVVQGFGQFLVVAKQFQRTYMVATISAATLNDDDTFQGESDYTCWHKKRTVIPDGMRARSMDVKVFLANATPISLTMEPVQYIPLMSPFPSKYPPRTVLPDPLPYSIVFKPHPPVSRSPFKLKQQRGYQLASGVADRPQLDGHSHGEANLRVRFVGNPAYLRLKALHNIIYERGIDWEGRGKECRISSGKEALPSIAVDGLGRSLLSVG
jgi:hypothetical protein